MTKYDSDTEPFIKISDEQYENPMENVKPSFATALIAALVVVIVLFGGAFAIACGVWAIVSLIF
jgi:hypothetical protein